MKSRWFKLKNEAINLRKQGFSMTLIEHKYGIARSTLSSWFKKVKLSPIQKKKLLQNSRIAFVAARKKAVLWHNAQKEKRLKMAKDEAAEVLKNININDKKILELALAILYLGEGSKKKLDTAIGSSDPVILKFFVSLLRNLYNIDIKKIKCQLNLRADQDPQKMKKFWAMQLNLPEENFTYFNLDKRTIGTKTYSSYKGVCHVRCGTASIQRKLINLSNMFCEKVIKKMNMGA